MFIIQGSFGLVSTVCEYFGLTRQDQNNIPLISSCDNDTKLLVFGEHGKYGRITCLDSGSVTYERSSQNYLFHFSCTAATTRSQTFETPNKISSINFTPMINNKCLMEWRNISGFRYHFHQPPPPHAPSTYPNFHS